MAMQSRGAQYSKIFRRAGMAWGRDDMPKAIAILEEGLALAIAHGDADVRQVLQRDVERYQRLAHGVETDGLGSG